MASVLATVCVLTFVHYTAAQMRGPVLSLFAAAHGMTATAVGSVLGAHMAAAALGLMPLGRVSDVWVFPFFALLAQEKRLGPASIGFVFLVLGLANTAARPGGWLTRAGRPSLYATAGLLFASMAIALLPHAGGQTMVLMLAAAFGVASGVAFVAVPWSGVKPEVKVQAPERRGLRPGPAHSLRRDAATVRWVSVVAVVGPKAYARNCSDGNRS
ncbi:MAG TPA: hypothetical protein VGD07_07510 [Methylomirabilota bacterium]